MEEDRNETNLGPTDEQDVVPELVQTKKEPRKRFVGRKSAAKAQEEFEKDGTSIESSSGLQGIYHVSKSWLSQL
jgi:2-(3-amino-3-carboxypropyl)histidine synthase